MYKSSLALAVAVGVLAQQAGAAGFLEDSKLNLSSRTYYYENDVHVAAAPSASNNFNKQNNQRETAEILKLDYLSGFTQGLIGVGIDAQLLYGLHLDGGAGHHNPINGNSFWPSDKDGSAEHDLARGDANVKFRVSKTELHVGGALLPQLPILLANDSRAMPQNFDGGIITSKDIDNVTLTAGQLEHSTGRASTNSTGLSVAGATKDSNQFRFAGGDWKATKDLTLQYYHANLEDFYKQDFFGLIHVLPIGDDQSFKTDLRYFHSSSDGKNSSNAAGYGFNQNGGYNNPNHLGEVDNNTWSTMFTYQFGGSAVLLGYQSVSDSGGFVLLNQGNVTKDGKAGNNTNTEDNGGTSFYLFTDATVNSFIRAGEQSQFAQYSYDFARAGVPGLKASINYIKGTDIRSNSAVTADKTFGEWERDFRLDYVVQTGYLKGFGTTFRTGSYHVSDHLGNIGSTRAGDQTRLIFNYTYSFL